MTQDDIKAIKRDSDIPFLHFPQDVFNGDLTRVFSMDRCDSATSSLSSNQDICRICHCEGDAELPLIAPCYCAGSLQYVHQSCLQQWIKSSDTKSCELCKFNFVMHSKIKPFNRWERLEMSTTERRKIACSVTFHVVSITCVVWSLYILIDRTSFEVQQTGSLEWSFWTKLIVVAFGFTGGLVFMYVQCKMYAVLCRRWRAYNRVIYVQNLPEKVPLHDHAEFVHEFPPSSKDPLGGESHKTVLECDAVVVLPPLPSPSPHLHLHPPMTGVTSCPTTDITDGKTIADITSVANKCHVKSNSHIVSITNSDDNSAIFANFTFRKASTEKVTSPNGLRELSPASLAAEMNNYPIMNFSRKVNEGKLGDENEREDIQEIGAHRSQMEGADAVSHNSPKQCVNRFDPSVENVHWK